MEKTFGFNDVPADKDLVEVESYLSGLAKFITKCQTPMTIAIQGDWGSGKTSAMNELKRNSELEKFWQIDFNTWQYSQFDLGDQLVFSLIGTILKELKKKIPQNQSDVLSKLGEIGKKLTRVSRGLFGGAGRTFVKNFIPYGNVAVDAVEGATQEYKNLCKESERESFGPDSSIQLITELRHSIEEIVQKIVGAKSETDGFQGPERIVIYVDDLDRLEPERAVMVMEAIKVFLDIKDCVFVLAIDFAVVLRGVRAKYGQDFEEDKARAFFDKIIQVPFQLPLGAYNVRNLLAEGLGSIGVEISKNADVLEVFDDLAQSSVGRNPRSIKRLVNTFGLIRIIGDILKASDIEAKAQDIHIFSILCMQISYPQIFEELTRVQTDEDRQVKWKEIREMAFGQGEDFRAKLKQLGISEYCEIQFTAFIKSIDELFSDNKKQAFDIELFNDALVKAAVTAVGSSEAMQEIDCKRGGPIQTFEERYQLWSEKYPQENKSGQFIAELGRIFEENMSEILGSVEASVNKNGLWSYLATDKSRVANEIKGKRFLELKATHCGLSPQFGTYLSDEICETVLKTMKDKFPEVESVKSEKSRPRFWFNRIERPEQAAYVAKLIAEIYMEKEE